MKGIGLNRILEDLKDTDPEIKRLAAKAILKESPSPDAVLSNVLEDADKPTAMAIYDVLFDAEHDFTQIFYQATLDSDARVRRQAIRYLFRKGMFKAEDGIRWLSDSDPYVRRRVISYLFWVHDRSSIDEVIRVSVLDPDPLVRKDALRLVSIWGEKKDVHHVIQALEDPSIEVRIQAIQTLKRLTGEDFGEPVGSNDDEFEWIVAKWQGWWEIMKERV
ncbi:MAG: HEAT repeat domain-containing protein [Desulfomonilia bacterium]